MSFFSKFKIGNTSYDVKDANAGKSLSLSGSDLSLKNADGTAVSTVSLPLGGNIDTVVGRFDSGTGEFVITIEKGTMAVGKFVFIKPKASINSVYLISATYNCGSASTGTKIVPCFGYRSGGNTLEATKWSASQALFGYIYDYTGSKYYVSIFNCPTSYDKYIDNSNLTSVDQYRNLIVNNNAVVLEDTTSMFAFSYNGTGVGTASHILITTMDGKFYYIAGFESEQRVDTVAYNVGNPRKYKPTYFYSYTNKVANPSKVGTLEYDYANQNFKLNCVNKNGSTYATSSYAYVFVMAGILWSK